MAKKKPDKEKMDVEYFDSLTISPREPKSLRRVGGQYWEKLCTSCGLWLPLTEFSYRRKASNPADVREEPQCNRCRGA